MNEYDEQRERMRRADRWVWWVVGAAAAVVIVVLVWTAGPADDGAYGPDDAPPAQPAAP